MKVSLVVVKGKPEGMEIPLKTSRFVIGREPGCHLRPGSDLVSKQHCVLTIAGETLTIADLGSTNGTFHNGTRISQEEVVRDGDLLKVGPLTFAVKIVAPKPVAGGPVKPSMKPAGQEDPGDFFEDWLNEPSAGSMDPQANSTIIDMRALSSEDTISESTAPPTVSPGAKPVPPNAGPKGSASSPPADAKKGSSEAASEMLNKLMIRRRSSS
ncbi:MAG: FHA domain-containing protein [Planctomycetota bacterium]